MGSFTEEALSQPSCRRLSSARRPGHQYIGESMYREQRRGRPLSIFKKFESLMDSPFGKCIIEFCNRGMAATFDFTYATRSEEQRQLQTSDSRSLCCNCSSDKPFVSGKKNKVIRNCVAIMPAKKTNGSDADFAARDGNICEVMPFTIHKTLLPRA